MWSEPSYLIMRRSSEETVMALRNSSDGELPPVGGAGRDERRGLDDLFTATYEELRRVASIVRRGDPSVTLNPTALVHQTWLKLAQSHGFGTMSSLHFKRIAGRAMRQVLIEAARRRHAGKRGGHALQITFDEAIHSEATSGRDLLALDAALDELALLNPRQAQVVESRYFGGLDIPAIAELLQISEATVLRDWRVAKAWLASELRQTTR